MKLSPKKRIIKNLIAINVSMFFLFSAFNDVLAVQNVLNKDIDLGTTAQALIFGVNTATCLVFPQIVIKAIGFKWTLFIAEIGFMLYVAANAYPATYTLIPTAIIVGFAQSLLWNIVGIYIAGLSKQYIKLSTKSFEQIQQIFLASFTSIFLLSYVLGSLLVANVLKSSPKQNFLNDTINATVAIDYDYEKYCGFNNCPSYKLPPAASSTTQTSVYILLGLLVILCLISMAITALFMDHIELQGKNTNETTQPEKETILTKFKVEFKNLFGLLKYLDIYLLFPLSFFTGLELTFRWNEFNRAFATCLKDVNYIGWTSLLFGFTGSFFSIVFGIIGKFTTQTPLIILAYTIAAAHSVFIMSWTATVENGSYVIFLMSLAFSIIEAITTVQIRGLYGLFFPNKPAAFNFASIFQAMGFVVGYIISLRSCLKVKNYVLFGITVWSLISYFAILSRKNLKERKAIAIASGEINDKHKVRF